SVMLSGMTEDITALYYALNKYNCVLQYTRSGRIAVTRSTVEQVSDFLEEQERRRRLLVE
ncbi:MAG: acetolactate synthase small subunit, partial [Prevotella sp.]|nr:acetolactate synthase small subunit [Prevotella sp.]